MKCPECGSKDTMEDFYEDYWDGEEESTIYYNYVCHACDYAWNKGKENDGGYF